MSSKKRNLSATFLNVIIFIFLLTSCTPDFIKKQDAKFHERNTLRYQVNFSMKKAGEAFIENWIPQDTSRFFSKLSAKKETHEIIIINLLPDTTYSYTIHARADGKTFESKIQQFRTGGLPEQLPAFKLTNDDYELNGYILIKNFTDPGALILLNQKAEIVWYHMYDTAVVRPFEFTHDGNILSLVDSSVIEETTLSGKLLRRINTKENGIDRLHHELFKNLKNQYVGLTYTRKVLDLSRLTGNVSDTLHADGIVVMDSTGKKVWDWDIFDHANPVKDDSLLQRMKDWGHANSIAYDKDGHFLVSFRDFSQIWKIHSLTGEVIWKLGWNGNFRIEGTEWFLKQHDAHINPDGDLTMFDNGTHLRGYSRVLALDIDVENFICRPVTDIKLGPSQTTYRMGSVRMIDSDHMLVCSPKKILSLTVYNSRGELVWGASGTRDSYKAYYLPKDRIENMRWF